MKLMQQAEKLLTENMDVLTESCRSSAAGGDYRRSAVRRPVSPAEVHALQQLAENVKVSEEAKNGQG